MGKSCLNGYLTPECAKCSEWLNGTNDKGVGCGVHYPIMLCPSFAKEIAHTTGENQKEGKYDTYQQRGIVGKV